jgi:hypothetical protein
MRQIVTFCLTLGITIATNSDAKCARFPLDSYVVADVRVWSCLQVNFAGSGSQGYGLGPMYQAGATLSGTMLGVGVLQSHIVRNEPKTNWGYDAHRWKVGEQETLFIAIPADEICPKSLPAMMTVSFKKDCCDVLPMKGTCLLPSSLHVVEVVKP